MQRYWSMRESIVESDVDKHCIRNYGFAKDAQDAIAKAKLNCTSSKETLVRVWVAFLEAVDPVFTLIFGEPKDGLTELPLDNASKGMSKAYKSSVKQGKGGKGIKPHVKIKNPPLPIVTPYKPYSLILSTKYSGA